MSRRWKHKFELKPGCWVFVPEEEAILQGRKIKQEIESVWRRPEYYFHLTAGGHVAALKSHLNSDVFIRADIHQFFNQINRSRVARNLKNIFRSYKKAINYADDSVVRLPNCKAKKYILPFGFVQSAIIASLCFRFSALGNFLEHLRKSGFVVSVYMDDIIISSRCPIDEMEDVYRNLTTIAIKSGFALNLEKMNRPSTDITAFNIGLSNGKLAITKKRLSAFESILVESKNPYQIDGILGYIKTVCPAQAVCLESTFSP